MGQTGGKRRTKYTQPKQKKKDKKKLTTYSNVQIEMNLKWYKNTK